MQINLSHVSEFSRPIYGHALEQKNTLNGLKLASKPHKKQRIIHL